jgi:hypothetical protein
MRARAHDGAALFDAICGLELKGIVGETAQRSVKNRDYWRYEIERESAMNARRPRSFV